MHRKAARIRTAGTPRQHGRWPGLALPTWLLGAWMAIAGTVTNAPVRGPVPGPDFTVAVLPDTQCYVGLRGGGRPEMFTAQVDWIVSNRAARGIAYVAHVGDIVERNDNGGDPVEWLLATNALYRLENPATTGLPEGIPYGVALGNHDTGQFAARFFGPAHFAGRSYAGGWFRGDPASHVDLFSAGGLDFVVLYLPYTRQPAPELVAWANAMLKHHAARRAILVTHSLISIGEPPSFTPEGEAWWTHLKDNPNLILALCGHISAESCRLETVDGRVIPLLLGNYQNRPAGGDGWMRLLEFSPSNNLVRVRTYSPVRDQWEADADSQFEVPCRLQPREPVKRGAG